VVRPAEVVKVVVKVVAEVVKVKFSSASASADHAHLPASACRTAIQT
jgi:hypothetical protein